MKIDLAGLARQRGVKRPRVKLRALVPTAVLENDLFAIYATGLNIWSQCMRDVLANYSPAPITTDADGEQLQWLVKQAASHADNTIIYQTVQLGRWTAKTGTWHGAKTISSVRSALGVDIEPFMRLSDVQAQITTSIAQNVSLIRDVNAKTRASVEQAIFDAFANRRTKKELTDRLAEILNITKVRARRIAGDQTHKLGIALTSFRNEQLGIKSYEWVTQHDDRVRRVHRERDGKVFLWAQPPWDGLPSYAPGCRCHAVSIVDVWPSELRMAA